MRVHAITAHIAGEHETMEATVSSRIPMILTGHALQSLRDSGFDLATALAEPIDNALEAGANAVRIRLDVDETKDKAGKKRIHRIAIADDGTGMPEDTLHHYLQLGYSTRYMSTTTIGKYGVGAKLAALTFGKRIDVWSRTSGSEPWRHVSFDLDSAIDEELQGGSVGIDTPTKDPVPPELEELAPGGPGTLVVWSKVDRLEEGRHAPDANTLRVGVERELSRIFRHFLRGGIQIWVNRTNLLPHDPLFLMDRTWADSKLNGHHEPLTITKDEILKVGKSVAKLTVTVYPKEVVRQRGKGGDEFAKELRIPENEGAISFVRLEREIAYTNVPRIFPRGVQEPDRFIGIQVSFGPELDQFFGVRNVKRGVEPHGELRADIRKLLQKYLPLGRERIEEIWGKASRESREKKGEHAAIQEALRDANRTLPKARAKGPESDAEREQILDDLSKDVGISGEGDKREYLTQIRELPFVIESVDFPGTNFIDIQHLGNQVIIRLNTRHRFYREMWEPVRDLAVAAPGVISSEAAARTARRTIEALILLLVAYGKAESMDQNPRERYGDLRGYWGQFLDSLMGKVKDVM